MSELRDRDAYWARLHERLDRREDPFDDDALLDWMAQHPEDAATTAVLCERLAAAPAARPRRRRLLAAACGIGVVVIAVAFAWLAERPGASAPPSEARAAALPPRVRVLAFEARSTAAGASFVEERVRDAAGERVTTIGADYATSRSSTLAARDTGAHDAHPE